MATIKQLNYYERMRGQVPWNKGLTKETDIRVKKYSDTKTHKIQKKCECGKEFEVNGNHKSQKYCSKECYKIYQKGIHNSPKTEFKKGERSPRYNKGNGFIDNQG